MGIIMLISRGALQAWRKMVPPPLAVIQESKAVIEALFDHRDLQQLTTEELYDLYRSLEEVGFTGPEIRTAVLDADLDTERFWKILLSLLEQANEYLPIEKRV